MRRLRNPIVVSNRERNPVKKDFILTLCYDHHVLSRLHGPVLAAKLGLQAGLVIDEQLAEACLRNRDGDNFYFENSEAAVEAAVKLADNLIRAMGNGKVVLVRTLLLSKKEDSTLHADIPNLIDYFSTLSDNVAILATEGFDPTAAAKFSFRLSTGDVINGSNLIYQEARNKAINIAKKVLYEDNHILFHVVSKNMKDVLLLLKEVGINGNVNGEVCIFITAEYSLVSDLVARLLDKSEYLAIADGYDIIFSTDTKEFSGRTYEKLILMTEMKKKAIFMPNIDVELKSVEEGEVIQTHVVGINEKMKHDVFYSTEEEKEEVIVEKEVVIEKVMDNKDADKDLLDEISNILDKKLAELVEKLAVKEEK